MLLLLFILIFIFFEMYLEKKSIEKYSISILVWIVTCYVSNEILSVFHILDRSHLSVIYGIIDISLIVLICIKLGEKKDFKVYLKSFFSDVKNNKLSLVFGGLFVGVFALACKTTPYNWDSMTYHLPRIMQWAQNKSVAHYVTHDIRQLTSPVLAEFINLQVYILTGKKDNIFNLLQCFSYITNAILIFHISRKLKITKNYCWLSMLLFASMPIAFGEALSTQVDHFSTLFLLIFIYYILDLVDEKHKLIWNRDNIYYVIILSACIGLGYLAKPSIMFGMVFFAMWLLIVSIRRKDYIKDVICLILLAIGIILVVISPEILRNIKTFNAISDPVAGARQLVGTIRPFYLVVNGLMNYTMNIPNSYINCGKLVEHGVYWIAYILGVNILDPSIAEDGRKFALHLPETYDHDMAINPIVVFFATIALLSLIVRKIKKEQYDKRDKYSIVAIGVFLFFCIILRWEPFVARYMLSYLALLCPVISIWLWKFKNSHRAAFVSGIITLMCITEIINLFGYHGNIVLQRKGGVADYFVVNERYIEDYLRLEEILGEIEFQNLGLYLEMANIYEYPIGSMLDDNVRVEHILTNNNSTKYEDKNFIPDVIIVMNRNEEEVVNYKGQNYVCLEKIDDNSSVWQLERGNE